MAAIMAQARDGKGRLNRRSGGRFSEAARPCSDTTFSYLDAIASRGQNRPAQCATVEIWEAGHHERIYGMVEWDKPGRSGVGA